MSITNNTPEVNNTFGEQPVALEQPSSPDSLGEPCDNSRNAPRRAISNNHVAGEPKYQRPLSIREGTSLDDRVVTNDGDAFTVRESVKRFRRYVSDSEDTASVFKRNGETISVPTEHRFTETYAKRRYAQLMEVDRTVIEEFANPHVVGITLTASPFNENGGWRCPVDHLEDLTASNSNVTSALRYATKGRESARLSVLGAHENGYAHTHVLTYVDGAVSREDFTGVIDSHVKNCPTAREDHHEYENAITVESVRELERAHDDFEQTPLATYLGGHLMGIGGSVLDADEGEQLFAASLWASNKRQWKPSQSFHDYLSDDSSADTGDSEDWKFVGMEVGGEVYDVDSESSNGKTMTEIRGLDPDIDPVEAIDGG